MWLLETSKVLERVNELELMTLSLAAEWSPNPRDGTCGWRVVGS